MSTTLAGNDQKSGTWGNKKLTLLNGHSIFCYTSLIVQEIKRQEPLAIEYEISWISKYG